MPFIIKISIAIFIPVFMGYLLMKYVFGLKNFNALEQISLSFGLGFGLLPQIMLLMAMLGFSFSGSGVTLFFVILTMMIIRIFGSKNNHQKNIRPFFPQDLLLNKTDPPVLRMGIIAGLGIVCYYIIYIFWAALNIPIHSWDAIATCAFKGKIIFYERSLNNISYFSHPSYPLGIPMILSWISFYLGEWNEQLVKIIFPLTFSAFIALFYSITAYLTNKRSALCGLVLLFSSNLLIWHAPLTYRDISLMYYCCTSLLLLLVFYKTKDLRVLLLSAVFLGMATFIKLEGLFYLTISSCVFIYLTFKEQNCADIKRKDAMITFFCPLFVMVSFFMFFKFSNGVMPLEHVEPSSHGILFRIVESGKYFFQTLIFSNDYQLIWILLFVCLFIHKKKMKHSVPMQLVYLSIVLSLLGLFTFFVISSKSVLTISEDALPRLLMPIYPMAILLIVLLNTKNKP